MKRYWHSILPILKYGVSGQQLLSRPGGRSKKGYALYNLGRFEDAVLSCTRALALNGNDASAWYIKGVSLDELGRTAEANEAYGKSLELEIISDMQADMKRDGR